MTAVTVNGSITSSNSAASSSTLAAGSAFTFNYTCPANTDCLAIIEVNTANVGNTTSALSAVSYNGVSATFVTGSSQVVTATNNGEISVWYLKSSQLTTGSSLVVSGTQSNYATSIIGLVCIPLIGTGQVITVGTPVTNQGSGTSATVTGSGAGSNDLYIGSVSATN